MRKKRTKVFIILISFFLLLISIVLLSIGIHYYKISKKDYIFNSVIDSFFIKLKELVVVDESYYIGDSFQIDGNAFINIESNNTDELIYSKKFLNNLSKLNINYIIAKDSKNKEFYTFSNGMYNNSCVFTNKRLINNSTEFRFLDGVSDEYINIGKNTYFESLTGEYNSIDNMNYIYDFLKNSLKKHISEDDLNLYDTSTYIGDKEVTVNQISYEIEEETLKKLYDSILKDIKNDNRANDIFSLFLSNLDSLKLSKKKRLMPKNSKLIINIYTSKKNYEILKYEVVYLEESNKKTYVYEGSNDKGLMYYLVNNEVKYQAKYKFSSKKTDIEVFDEFDKPVGSIHLDKDKSTLNFTVTLNLDNNKYDISYYENSDNLSDEGYNKINVLSFKVMDNLTNVIQGEIKLDNNIKSMVKINEDVSNATLKIGFKEEENNRYDSYYDNLIMKIESLEE